MQGGWVSNAHNHARLRAVRFPWMSSLKNCYGEGDGVPVSVRGGALVRWRAGVGRSVPECAVHPHLCRG